MDRTERFYLIDRLLSERGTVTLATFIAELQVSRATLMRDLSYLRDRLNAPIFFDRERGGYRLNREQTDRYLLPGVWFNASEIHALLAMQQLLTEIGQGLLGSQVAALERRLRALLGEGGLAPDVVLQRIRLVPFGRRSPVAPGFETVASALLGRRRLQITHHNRNTDQTIEREISPQRLVYYRDNWYLDAWCHLRKDLRSFSIDAIRTAASLPEAALDIPPEQIADRFDTGYGIFSHPTACKQWATLRFTEFRARWIANEHWHPDQRIRTLENGELQVEVPYHDPRELIADVLRQGSHCEVLEPAELRSAIAAEVEALASRYRH